MWNYLSKHLIVFTALLFLPIISVFSQSSEVIILKDGLAIKLGRYDSNKIISPNAIIAAIETGEWETPSENKVVKANGNIIGTWKRISTNEDGWIRDDSLLNAYVYFQYQSEKEEVALLEGMGHSMVYVNGSPRSGNPYCTQEKDESWGPRFDYSLIPIKLKKGINEFVFECNREGVLKVKIHPGKNGLTFNEKDLTVPDILINESVETFGAIPIINATEKNHKDLFIKTWIDNSTPEFYPVKDIQSLSVFKTPFKIKLPVQQNVGTIKFNIELVEKKNSKENVLASSIIELNVVSENETHKETFISNMDGSVQYYAVNPPVAMKSKPALFLSLHGAGVEAINQAQAYGHKNWGYIVAPTNRRPYGYNWENWGRLDALEVLNLSKKKFAVDENRIYLTGHSMGGHGAWHLGINYSDQFAAIGPSAGWISIWSYRIKGMTDSSDVTKMLTRSTKQSDTYAFSTNLMAAGIYVLQGDVDDNVLPEQAKSMIDNLSKFHKDYQYHEEHGANHWWDNSDEPGADCVDWLPMFDYFARHAVPGNERTKEIEFVTANPAISSKNNWIEIVNQIQQQKLSKINIRLETGNRKFIGTTGNIEVLEIDASMLSSDKRVSVLLDKQVIPNVDISKNSKISLRKENDKWALISKINRENKYPSRCGNFREALNHNVVFVYGTNGSKEENNWAIEKARYDAEKIWYQGNGSIEIIKDDDFDTQKYKDRNVILFGNSKTNSAWYLLLKDSPVQIDNNKIEVGDKEFKGKDLACLMIRPRKDSEIASVGVIAGTGIEGMKLSDFAQYSHPYTSLPDIVIYNSGIISSDEEGVKFTGYFGNDWSLVNGEFVIQ